MVDVRSPLSHMESTNSEAKVGLVDCAMMAFALSFSKESSTALSPSLGAYAGYHDKKGEKNVFLGAYSGSSNSTGQANMFSGYRSGYTNKSGAYNTFSGYDSGYSISDGSHNTFTGSASGFGHKDSHLNTFTGFASGRGGSGGYSVHLGAYSGYMTGPGSHNTYLGFASGYLGSGSYNVYIGNNAGSKEFGSNKLYIANSGTKTPLIHGDFSAGTVTINGTLTQTSDGRLKREVRGIRDALSRVERLRGVRFSWRSDEAKNFPTGRQLGLVSQEVAEVVPEVVVTNSNGYQAVAYGGLTALLVEGMKQQQRTIKDQQQAMAAQQRQVATQQRQVDAQKRQVDALQRQVHELRALVARELAARRRRP